MKTPHQRLEDIYKRVDKLNLEGIKPIFYIIADLDKEPAEIYFKILVKDRFNNILQEQEIHDIPRDYLNQLADKYNDKIEFKGYKILNNQVIEDSI